ncbi:MAG: FAD-dependent oxidoreductase, partial [Candidatus Gastranaerophilales bacterium]|nr:FAD-dependent oxidoreductase [Candidatus Gastranaerophilales bacterium]
KYIVDATADGVIFKLLNCNFQNKSDSAQSPSLRFILSNINIDIFSSWLEDFDKNREVTTIQRTDNQIYLSTACTWDKNKGWALTPLFEQAVNDKILEYSDTAYFQIFSMPQMKNSLNFNCPRILLDDDEDLEDPFVYSRALIQGRERVYRISNFCKKFLPGFQNSYISHISDILGVRELIRVKGKYTFTTDDIINPKKFDNIALACNYPIDIHSNKKISDKLEFSKETYYLPVEALISDKYDNLYAAGRIVSADFEAQSALRTQLSCFSMGEAAAKDILKKSGKLL